MTHILPHYKDGQDINETEGHQKDIAKIVKALATVDSIERRNALLMALKATQFLRAENAIGDTEFRKPDDIIYFRNQTLEMYFEGNRDGWFISSHYEQYFDDLKQLNIFTDLARKSEPKDSGYIKLQTPYKGSESYPHKRGLDGFNPDFTIDGLEFALNNPTVERSIYIWNRLLLPSIDGIVGTVESSPVQSFPSHRTDVEKNVLSRVGRLVHKSSWLPDGNGNFVKPSELSLDELPDDFRKDNDLANVLGMRPNETSIQDFLSRDDIADDVKRRFVLANEFSIEDLELMRNNRELLDQLRRKQRETVETLSPDEYPPELENRFNSPSNPISKRRDRFDSPVLPDNAAEDEVTETELGLNQKPELDPLIIGRKQQAKNRDTEKFLLHEYGGQCQICDTTFEQRNGSPYFAIAHLIRRSQAKWLDDPRNALCLCANHWAQFKYGELKTLDEEILDQITTSEEEQPHDIFIMLCKEPQAVTFSANHISKLRALVEVTENL